MFLRTKSMGWRVSCIFLGVLLLGKLKFESCLCKKMKESLHWDHGKLFISSVEFYPRNQKMTQMTQKKTPFTVLSKFLGDFCLSSLKKCNVSLLGISNVPSYEGPRFHTVSWKTCPEPAKWGGNKKTGGNFRTCKANPLKKKSKRYLSLVVFKLLNK